MMKQVERLVNQARSGEIDRARRHAAFCKLVQQFEKMAYAWAYGILRDSQLAQDATQEAFIKAYQKLDQLREPKAFPGWLRRIVSTECNRLTRGKQVPTTPMDGTEAMPAAGVDPALTVEQRDLKAKVLTAIETLPEHERVVVRLFYMQGYSLKEVAGALSLPITTIKKRLQYARRRLRRTITEQQGISLMSCQHGVTRTVDKMVAAALALLRPYSSPRYTTISCRDRHATLAEVTSKDEFYIDIALSRY